MLFIKYKIGIIIFPVFEFPAKVIDLVTTCGTESLSLQILTFIYDFRIRNTRPIRGIFPIVSIESVGVWYYLNIISLVRYN